MDDVAVAASYECLLQPQRSDDGPQIGDGTQGRTMASQNEGIDGTFDDNGVGGVAANITREMIDFSQVITGDSLHAISQTQTALAESTTNHGNDGDDGVGLAANTNELPTTTTAASRTTKQSRKTAPRSKQYLLATKEFFLKANAVTLCDAEPNMVLQGYVLECPNRTTNQGQYRIDWQRNTVLPPTINTNWLQEWFPSTKGFRDMLDKAIQRWADEATVEQKDRVSRKRRSNCTTITIPAPPQTPPARREHLEARAMMRTEASTAMSSLSSRSAMFSFSSSQSLRDRRPPIAPSPTTDADAAESDDDASVTTASTRSTLALDSDSEDGSQLDENDNMHDDYSSEDELEDDCRPHVEAPDLSERARGFLGQYLKALQWRFEVITDTTVNEPYRPHTGPHGLRAGVAQKFNDPFECFAECGGFTPAFVARLAANSNDYYHYHIKPDMGRNRYCNEDWRDISTGEMYRFLGIMLKISLSTVDGGGYAAYFSQEDKVIYADSGRKPITMTIGNSKGWAHEVMKFNRFKQIRGAFHPEDKTAGIGKDKCYQLRHALNQLNAAALSTFHMGPNMAFDEGGVACRSRFCPVRQCNKDKPDKCRVDFFMLNDSKYYFIYHMDVYQGKNKHNAYIHKYAADLPTTQKAVVNSLFKTDLSLPHPSGYRHIAMDNRYNCPELLCILRDKCRIYGTGTCRKKRKGWDSTIHKMTKDKSNRGECVLSYDSLNKIICGEWLDSKVVTFATSVMDSNTTTVERRIGSQKKVFSCPKVLTMYQSTMGGVD